MAPSPRVPHRWSVATAATAMVVCGPAIAADPSAVAAALWASIGAGVAVAATMVVGWQVLRDRIARRATWVPFVAGTLLLALLAWRMDAGARPWLLVASVAWLGWGLALVSWLARRILRLLEERDHARAEARRVRQDSERDALTGVLNRGAWRNRLEKATADAVDSGRPVSVLFFDIDLFKLVNDSLGHGVGDDCLRVVSATVGEELRGGDVLGRLGGEEFAVILPGARRIHALAVAERIRQSVQQHCKVVGEEIVELTVSIGAAEYLGPDEPLDTLMERADRAMYVAKDSGRNMVVADPQSPVATEG